MKIASVTFSLFALAGTAVAQQELYVHGGDGVIYRIDDYATQPTPVMVGATSLPNGNLPTDLAIEPSTGDFYMTVFPSGSASGSYTYRIDPVTFDETQIGGFQLFSLNSLDFTPDGRLFGNGAVIFGMVHIDLTNGGHTFITTSFDSQTAGDCATSLDGKFLMTTALGDIEMYDPVSGLITNLGPHGFGSAAFGLEIDTDGTIYILLDTGDIYTYDLATMTPTFVGATGLEVFGAAFKLPAGPDLGDSFAYCQNAVPNSTGAVGQMAVTGSTVAADNAMTLVATDVPPNSFGVFVVGRFLSSFGGGSVLTATDGRVCIGDFDPGYFRAPSRIQSTGSSGQFSLGIDLMGLPPSIGITSVSAGGRLAFQGWFRDSGPNGSNLTNATCVFFR